MLQILINKIFVLSSSAGVPTGWKLNLTVWPKALWFEFLFYFSIFNLIKKGIWNENNVWILKTFNSSEIRYTKNYSHYNLVYAFKANFLWGNVDIFLTAFKGLRFAWKGVSFLRIALVFFGLKSRGLYFLFLYKSRRFSFCFWCITICTRAIAFRRTRLEAKKK